MTINSLTQTLTLQNLIRTEQQSLATLQQQIGSQKISTTYSGLTPAQGSLSISLRAQLSRFDAYTSTSATLGARLSAADNALTSSYTAVSNLSQTITSIPFVNNGTAQSFAGSADGVLSQIVGEYNTQVNGVPVFAGQSGTPPIQSAATIEANVRTAIGAAPGYTNGTTALNAVIAALGNTTATGLTSWSTTTAASGQGDDQFPGSAQTIADGRKISASLTAIPANSAASVNTIAATGSGYVVNDLITLNSGSGGTPVVLRVTAVNGTGGVTGATIATNGNGTYVPNGATFTQGATSGSGTGAQFTLNTAAAAQASPIQGVIQAVAAVAVLQPSDFTSASAYQDFIDKAVPQLKQALGNLSAYDGQVGILQKQISDQQTVNQSVQTLTQTNLNSDENIDPAKAITDLQNLQTQLQATYHVTAALRGLSLVNYI